MKFLQFLENLLKKWGVREPESRHIAMAEALVFSDNPSARAGFPGNITLERCYGSLRKLSAETAPGIAAVNCPGTTELPQWGVKITCAPAEKGLRPVGTVVVRSRLPGDEMRLPGGTKTLKKLFIDRKLPADRRPFIPVVADAEGVLAAEGIGINLDRLGDTPSVCITFLKKEN